VIIKLKIKFIKIEVLDLKERVLNLKRPGGLSRGMKPMSREEEEEQMY
jgi:hypothetical protein